MSVEEDEIAHDTDGGQPIKSCRQASALLNLLPSSQRERASSVILIRSSRARISLSSSGRRPRAEDTGGSKSRDAGVIVAQDSGHDLKVVLPESGRSHWVDNRRKA
jgi:hypothetical protein